MRTDTITATIIDAEVTSVSNEAVSELERFIGTYETYGSWINLKPALSSTAVIPADLLKAS